jgi:hypothetical protein
MAKKKEVLGCMVNGYGQGRRGGCALTSEMRKRGRLVELCAHVLSYELL